MSIQDEPRFGYRALLLDASRFFIPKENVLRIIDCMAMLKINTLHFHLTDDNGWRVEIKKYPRLTEVGAWRVDRTDLPFPARRNPEPGEPTPVGGFYTQEEIKEMVAMRLNVRLKWYRKSEYASTTAIRHWQLILI